MKKLYLALTAILMASAASVPQANAQAQTKEVVFDMLTYDNLATYCPGLPATSTWGKDGTTSNVFYNVTEMSNEDVTLTLSAPAGTAPANSPKVYQIATSGATDLRLYTNNTLKITVPSGGVITKIYMTTSASVNTQIKNWPATIDGWTWINEPTKTVTFTPNAGTEVSEFSVTATGTTRIGTLTVTYEMPAAHPLYVRGELADGPANWENNTVVELTPAGYVFQVTGQFKICNAETAPTNLDEFNAGCYKLSQDLALEQVQTVNIEAAPGAGNLEVPYQKGDNDVNCVWTVTVDKDFTTMKYEGSVAPPTQEIISDICISGDFADWPWGGNAANAPEKYKFTTDDGKNYMLDFGTVTSSMQFKIVMDNNNWYTAQEAINLELDKEYTLGSTGDNMTLAVDAENVVFYVTKEGKNLTLKVEGTPAFIAPELFIRGVMNDWDAVPAWQLTTQDDVTYTLTNVTLEKGQMFKVANGSWEGSYTYTYFAEPMEVDKEYTMVNNTESTDDSNSQMAVTVEKATVTYNLNTHVFKVTGTVVKDEDPDPDPETPEKPEDPGNTDPEKPDQPEDPGNADPEQPEEPEPTSPELYVIGTIAENAWPAKGVKMTEALTISGVYTVSDVEFVAAENNDYGYFAFAETLGTWDEVNALRYGPLKDGTPASPVLANGFGSLESTAWSILPGIYDITVDLNGAYMTIKSAASAETITIGEIEYTVEGETATLTIPYAVSTGLVGKQATLSVRDMTVEEFVARPQGTLETTVDLYDEENVITVTIAAGAVSASAKVEIAMAGIDGVVIDADSDMRYFNMQGVEIKNPVPGFYIEVSGNTVRKVYVK